jgi:SOS-response transcriptional repressor LexA
VTERQGEYLDFFRGFAAREGVPPSVREIAKHFDVSPRAVHDVLRILARDGHLRHRAGARRAHAYVLPERQEAAS